jgi:hypothetical protein
METLYVWRWSLEAKVTVVDEGSRLGGILEGRTTTQPKATEVESLRYTRISRSLWYVAIQGCH